MIKVLNNVVWVFGFYQSFLMSSLRDAWKGHRNRLSIKANDSGSRCVCLCLVTRQMFQSTCSTTHGLLLTHFLTSFICFWLSVIVKGLPMCNFNCETCFCQIFWPFGTEFLCFANLSFRFVVTRSIWFLAAICSAYKWMHPHLAEFQCNEKGFFSKTLGCKLRPLLGLKFHWTLALICVKIARLIAK